MKRMSSVGLTEAPMAVTPMMSLSLGTALKASLLLFGCPRRRGSSRLARALGDRFDDIVVAGATADVAFEAVADRSFVEIWTFAIDEVDRGHDHARRAEAA